MHPVIAARFDDATTLARSSIGQWQLLVSNQHRFEWVLWRWLRLRSRARHVVAALLNREFRLFGLASRKELDEETSILGRTRQLLTMVQIETATPLLNLATPEQIGQAIKSQLEERRIAEHIEEALEFNEYDTAHEAFPDNSETPLQDAIIARCEARAVAAELKFILQEDELFLSVSNAWNDAGKNARSLDSKLSEKVRSEPALKKSLAGIRNLMFPHRIPMPPGSCETPH